MLEILGRHDAVDSGWMTLAPTIETVGGLIEALRDPQLAPRSPCAQAKLANNLGWIAILSSHPGPEARTDLEAALNLFSGACDRAPDRANTLTNLAQAALAAQEWSEAEGYLVRADAADREPRGRFAADRSLTWGHAELGDGRPWEALDHFKKAFAESRSLALPVGIAAGFSIGEAYEDLADPEGALAAYADADGVLQLSRFSAIIQPGTGRATYTDRYHHGVQRYLELLMKLAEDAPPADDTPARRAACVARRSRARVRVVAEWEHRVAGRQGAYDQSMHRAGDDETARDAAIDALAGGPAAPPCEPPAADEVLLIFHPLLDGQWAGFAICTSAR